MCVIIETVHYFNYAPREGRMKGDGITCLHLGGGRWRIFVVSLWGILKRKQLIKFKMQQPG